MILDTKILLPLDSDIYFVSVPVAGRLYNLNYSRYHLLLNGTV